MEITDKARNQCIDVVKGIGIISIVMGHASWVIEIAGHSIQIGPFVYLYHLSIFFFCSGFCFKDNITNYWEFIAKKMKGLLVPFMGYTVLYLIFRNLFVDMGILAGEKYDLDNWLISLTNMITFNGVGELLGAFWFLPVLFFSIIFYAAINYVTSHIKRSKLKHLLRILCYVIFASVGIYATENRYGLLYNIQISYLMVPVIAAGHFCAAYKEKLNRVVRIEGLFISAVILISVLKSEIGIIELSNFMIINRYLFYPVTFCGIYFCFCLGKIVCKNNKLKSCIALAGKLSFDIMALHFFAFKLVDYVVCMIINKRDIMDMFPHSFDHLWLLYYITGIFLPVTMKRGYEALKRCMGSKIQQDK